MHMAAVLGDMTNTFKALQAGLSVEGITMYPVSAKAGWFGYY